MFFRFFIIAIILLTVPCAAHALQANSNTSGPAKAAPVAKGVDKNAEPDFSKMPVEDAIMLMFQLISEDARKDTRDLLAEMDATRKKKAALREAEQKMKEEQSRLRGKVHDEYDSRLKKLERDKAEVDDKQKQIFSRLKRRYDRDRHLMPKHDNTDRLKPKHENDRLMPKHDDDSKLMPKHDNTDRLKPKHPDNHLMPKHTATQPVKPCPQTNPNCLQPAVNPNTNKQ